MMTIELAETPLDYAWLAARQIFLVSAGEYELRQIARSFAKSGGEEIRAKTLAVLQEAHAKLSSNIADDDGYHVPGELERLATDFAALGHKAEALAVLAEALDDPCRSSGKKRVVKLGENALGYIAIGEPELALPLLQEGLTLTMELCPADHELDDWAQPLFTALLQSGKTAKAWQLAKRFKWFAKTEAFAAMAVHGRKNGYGRRKLLDASVSILEKNKPFHRELFAYSIVLMLAEKGVLGLERRLLKIIEDKLYKARAAIAVAEVHYSRGDIKPAMSMLKRAGKAATRIEDSYGQIKTWAKLIYEKLGNHEAALEFADMIRCKAENSGDIIERCRFNIILIGVYASLGRLENADKCVDKVLNPDQISLEELNAPTYAHPAAMVLYDLAMAIAECGLEFSSERRKVFCQQLANC